MADGAARIKSEITYLEPGFDARPGGSIQRRWPHFAVARAVAMVTAMIAAGSVCDSSMLAVAKFGQQEHRETCRRGEPLFGRIAGPLLLKP